MEQFSGKNTFITGASSGLGAAIALGIAREGGNVAINFARNKSSALEVAKACEAYGHQVAVVQGDVSSNDECLRMAQEVAGWNCLDVLVNNAGITKHVPNHADLDGLSAEDFQRLYAVNLIGPFQMLRALRPMLIAASETSGKAASVVNISSSSALTGIGSSVAYVASKAALNGMTLSLARALAPEIRINSVCPGYIDTNWFEKGLGLEKASAVRDAVTSITPLRAASKAEDIADVALFLASNQSRHMTGEVVGVDAGLHLATPLTGSNR